MNISYSQFVSYRDSYTERKGYPVAGIDSSGKVESIGGSSFSQENDEVTIGERGSFYDFILLTEIEEMHGSLESAVLNLLKKESINDL